jgi:hypothetical protein
MMGDNGRLEALRAAQPQLFQQTLKQMDCFTAPAPPAPVSVPEPYRPTDMPPGWHDHIDYQNNMVVYIHNHTGGLSTRPPTIQPNAPIVGSSSITTATPDGVVSSRSRSRMPSTPSTFTDGTLNEPIELFSDHDSVGSDVIANATMQDVIHGLWVLTNAAAHIRSQSSQSVRQQKSKSKSDTDSTSTSLGYDSRSEADGSKNLLESASDDDDR